MYYIGPSLELGSISQPWLESSAKTTSYILASDKKDTTRHELDSISPNYLGHGISRPYLAIQLGLRMPDKDCTFALTDSETALPIYAPGINTQTYPLLDKIKRLCRC